MPTPLELFVGVSWFVNLILDIGAAYYCYRMTRITGGFRAWWLIIAFTVLFAVSSFSSVSYGVLSSQALRAATSVSPALTGTAIFNVVLGLLMSVLLFTAMFELRRTFRLLQKADETRK